MARGLLYLDSSALVKLVVPESETNALLQLLPEWPDRVSSEIASVEVVRAARRASADPAVHRRAREVVAAVVLIKLDEEILELAAAAVPTTLRSLDAIHLASAIALRPDVEAMVAYDATLATAAEQAGFTVLAPGR